MNTKSFSERHNYKRNPLVREDITPEIQNAICTCYDMLEESLGYDKYTLLEKTLWCRFLNERLANYDNYIVATAFLENNQNMWYEKFDMVECTITILFKNMDIFGDACATFTENLNKNFLRLNYAYKVINNKIVDVISEVDAKTINDAIQNSPDNVKNHLTTALELYSIKPIGEYRNSIKESISAVEAICNKITDREKSKDDLGKALCRLKKKGIHPQMEQAFRNLYNYTSDSSTGIRHYLMGENAIAPGPEEALYMLSVCSAFITYLNGKFIGK